MKLGHVHTPDDGRGLRAVFVDGKEVEGAFYADTRRGIVRAYRYPLRVDKSGKRCLSRVLRGHVEVRQL